MKVLYVSDNRCRGNFGCRGTSTALSQIIEKKHTIVGYISGRVTNWNPGNLVFKKNWSSQKYINLSKKKYWSYISIIYYMFHRFMAKKHFFLGKYDFINYDFEKSINNLIRCIPANPFLKEFDLRQYDFDAMVVNGEGSFIFATPPWRESMILSMLMYWAQKMGKKVFFLNSMLSDDPNSEHNEKTICAVKNIFKKCNVVQVREMTSFAFGKKYFCDSNIVFKPDALFSWYPLINDDFDIKNGRYIMPFGKETNEFYYKYDFTKPYILICGSSSSKISKNLTETINIYTRLTNKIKEEYTDYNVFLIQACEGDEFLNEVAKRTNTLLIPMETPIVAVGKILSKASLFFTGRYHPAILASLGGTPCVFMSSNSHKTKSLQDLLNYKVKIEFSCEPSDDEIKQMILLGKKYLSDNDIRTCIKNKSYALSLEANTIGDLIK